MRLTEITMFALVVLLTISVGVNVFMYTGSKPDPDPEIVTVSDTIVRVDTILRVVTNKVVVEKPVPVLVDTVTNLKTYRDTIYHQFGTIRREEVVFGDLIRKGIEFDLQIPEVTKTLTISTVKTQYIRRRLLFATAGFQSDFNGFISPTVGGQYVLRDHRISLSYNYTFSGDQHSVIMGYNIFR